MGLFAVLQRVIAVTGSRQRDGIKRRCVECDHRHQHDRHDQWRTGQRLQNADDHAVQIPRLVVQRYKIRFAGHLLAHGIVAQHDKAGQRGANTEHIAAQNGLADSASPGNTADKKRGCHTPDHPVGPVVDCPRLREVGSAQRVGKGGKVVHHPSQ